MSLTIICRRAHVVVDALVPYLVDEDATRCIQALFVHFILRPSAFLGALETHQAPFHMPFPSYLIF